MFTPAKQQRTIAEKTIYNRLNEAIGEAVNNGAMHLNLDKSDTLCRNIQNHPEKNKIFEELKNCGYTVVELVAGTIKISW